AAADRVLPTKPGTDVRIQLPARRTVRSRFPQARYDHTPKSHPALWRSDLATQAHAAPSSPHRASRPASPRGIHAVEEDRHYLRGHAPSRASEPDAPQSFPARKQARHARLVRSTHEHSATGTPRETGSRP